MGNWGGVRVRLHALFLLVGIATMFLSTRSGDADLIGYGAMCLAVLLLSVLAHELAHRAAALRVGGHSELIVLGPLGGMTEAVAPPHEPQSELLVALAGPAANFLLWAATGPLLWFSESTSLVGLLNPLRPEAVVEGSPLIVLLKLTFWINWLLVLVSLLPAYPFDGGRVIRALCWPLLGSRQATIVSAWTARVTALGLCLVAWAMHSDDVLTPVPAWVPLASIAVFLLFSANQQFALLDRKENYDESLGYDFSQDFANFEQEPPCAAGDTPGMFTRWLAKRREQKQRQKAELEALEESRVDEILARLHGTGMESLTAEERAVLERVSARYRNRMKSS